MHDDITRAVEQGLRDYVALQSMETPRLHKLRCMFDHYASAAKNPQTRTKAVMHRARIDSILRERERWG